jgi:hypothetical protein
MFSSTSAATANCRRPRVTLNAVELSPLTCIQLGAMGSAVLAHAGLSDHGQAPLSPCHPLFQQHCGLRWGCRNGWNLPAHRRRCMVLEESTVSLTLVCSPRCPWLRSAAGSSGGLPAAWTGSLAKQLSALLVQLFLRMGHSKDLGPRC